MMYQNLTRAHTEGACLEGYMLCSYYYVDIINGKGWEKCFSKLMDHFLKISDLSRFENHGGINQLTPKFQILFQVSKLGSPRLHLENNCLFVLELNLRRLLESRGIRIGSGLGTFSLGEKNQSKNNNNKKKHQ